MALTQGELQRIKHEVGINQLTVGAEPYVGVTRYFEQIVLPYLQSGPITTSSTVVGCGCGSVSLALVSSVGFSLFDRAIVDVDVAQEEATVQSVVGNSITLQLAKAHGSAGAYPVTVEGGESLVRTYLRKCRYVSDQIEQFGPRAGLKKADEVEFFGGAHGRSSEKSGYMTLVDMQRGFRTELCMLLFGVGNIQQFGGGGSRIGVY
jgi:hypothetical protein